MERRKQEIHMVEAKYGELEIGPNLDWLIIKHWKLAPGWTKTETSVLVLIPPGYPVTPPDNFYTDNDLNLANDMQPGNTSTNQRQVGRQWLQFSYHVELSDWQPTAEILQGHNLHTFLAGVAKRLSEVS